MGPPAVLLAETWATRPIEVVFYIFFGYPIYAFATTVQKGVAFGWADSKVLSMRIRNAEYYDRLMAINAQPAVTEVPLADNKGVWRH